MNGRVERPGTQDPTDTVSYEATDTPGGEIRRLVARRVKKPIFFIRQSCQKLLTPAEPVRTAACLADPSRSNYP